MANRQHLLPTTGTPPAMTGKDPSPDLGNTCTVTRWHLEQTPISRKSTIPKHLPASVLVLIPDPAEAEHRSALAAAETAKLKARFQVSRIELEASQKQWVAWLNKRFNNEGAPDFVTNWRSYVRAPGQEGEWDERVGEARFSRVVGAVHERCVLCRDMEAVRRNIALSREEMVQCLRRLEHTVPKLQILLPDGALKSGRARDVATYDDMMIASAWGHEPASSTGTHTAVSRKGLLDNMRSKPDNRESTVDVQEGQWRLSRAITTALVNSIGDDNELLDEISNQKTFEQHAKAVKQRVNVYKENRIAARLVLSAADEYSLWSNNDIEQASKAKADALELERDLAILAKTQRATTARIEQAKQGYGRNVLEYNKKFCEMRRYKWRAGMDREEEGIEYRSELAHSAAQAQNSPLRVIKLMREEYQGRRSLRGSPAPSGESSPVSDGSPAYASPIESAETPRKGSSTPGILAKYSDPQSEEGLPPAVMTASPENLFEKPDPFAKTVQESNAKTREQEDSTAGSTDRNPFALETVSTMASTKPQGAEPGIETATASSPKGKGKAKNDFKVEDLLEEDGISLKDFAPEIDRTGRPFRKLSVKAGSSSRPKVDPLSQPAWKH